MGQTGRGGVIARLHREDARGGADVEAEAREEERERAVGRQRAVEAVQVARHQLAGGALRELREEAVHLRQVGHPPLAELVVLDVDDAAAAQHRLVPGEDVLREVDLLRRLRAAAARHEVELVEHVGVAVVRADVELHLDALPPRPKESLLHRRVDCGDEAGGLGEDVLGEADDRHRPLAARAGLADRRCLNNPPFHFKPF